MSFIDKIELSAERYGDRIAVDDGSRQITYTELIAKSNAIAHILMEQDNGEFAAVMLPRSCWFTVAAIGVIKAGKAYIPLNPANPAGYNLDILRESGAKSLITTAEIWEGFVRYAGYDINPVLLDRLELYAAPDCGTAGCDGSKPAALYFTSGTTGVRKGVLHSSDSLMFLCESVWRSHFEDGLQNEMFAVVTDLEFMASVAGLFTPLMHGGTSILVPDDVLHDIDRLADFLMDRKISHVVTIGPVAAMLAARWKGERLFLMATGERMPSICSALPDGLSLYNVYGMSECGNCLHYLIHGDEQTVPIGHTVDGVRAYVLDSGMNPVPDGQAGELYVSSPGLAIGYFNNPELSRRNFVDCPFEDGGRMYRTGDLVRMLPDGEYLYCGRVDDMVKVRGHRLELGDVENAALECEGIEYAVAVKSHAGGLVMFYSGNVEEDAVRSHLKGRLPEYMCPGRIVRIGNMPRGNRGKTDRKQLRNMASWSEKEICLAAAFEKILKIPVTDTDFDFIGNGGDSLSVMTLTYEMDGYSLDAATVYRERTLKRIASAMERIPDDKDDGLDARYIALNAFQRRILETQLSKPSSTMWNNPLLFRLGKDCDIQRLSDALFQAVCHHPILLARLCWDENGFFMFERADGFPDKGQVVRSVSVGCSSETDIIGSLSRPFDLMQGWPLFRIYIVSAVGTDYLFLDFLHLICDGFSICVFMENVFRAYRHQALPTDYGWQYMPMVQKAGKVDLAAVCETDLEFFTCGYETGITEEQIRNAENRWGHSINVLAVASGLLALSRLGAAQPVCVNWLYGNRVNARLKNAFAPLVRIYGVNIDVGSFTGKSLLDEISRQMEYSIRHPETEYYCLEDSDLRHQPLLINNMIGFDGFCSSAPFEIREIPYCYAQSEPAEYMDMELHLSEGCLEFNLVGAESGPSCGFYKKLGPEFERCLKEFILER